MFLNNTTGTSFINSSSPLKGLFVLSFHPNVPKRSPFLKYILHVCKFRLQGKLQHGWRLHLGTKYN